MQRKSGPACPPPFLVRPLLKPRLYFNLVCAVGTSKGWSVHQVNAKTAFLYGILPEDKTVYMEQPEGFAEGYPADEWV